MKVGIIGAGNVGSNIAAQLVCGGDVDSITLVDIFNEFAQGKALDLSHMASIYNRDIIIRGGSDYKLIENFDLVIITAGQPRKVGQSRDDLLVSNGKIVFESAQNVAKFAPNSVIIVVTNPLDMMVHAAQKGCKFDKSRVFGMAGELDGGRLRYEISKSLNILVSTVKADVVGVHGDGMIVVKEQIRIKNELNSSLKDYEEIEQNTVNSGIKVNQLTGSSAYFAPAAATVKMANAVIKNSNEILSCSVLDDDGVAIGRFVKINRKGISEVVDFEYCPKFEHSKTELKSNIDKLKL